MSADSAIQEGRAHLDAGDPLKARDAFDAAKSVSPDRYDLLALSSFCDFLLGRYDDAYRDAVRAVPLAPDDPEIHALVGRSSFCLGRNDEALDHFRTSARLRLNGGIPESGPLVIKTFRFKHDLDQLAALKERGDLDATGQTCLKAFQSVWSAFDGTGETISVSRDSDAFEPLALAYSRRLHDVPGNAVSGGALNGALDWQRISSDYLASDPSIVVVDDFLSADALLALRQRCLYGTIWRRDMADGYLAATLEDGLDCPLALQIADDLGQRLPEVFQDHRLTYAWAFKYDSTLNGTQVHADDAVINVNFWLTDDEANLSPDRGGLIVWNKKPPPDWRFESFNDTASVNAMKQYLKSQGADRIRIPYRTNRAVIFDSDLFHETDAFTFKDDYLSRRINVTYLHGRSRTGRQGGQ